MVIDLLGPANAANSTTSRPSDSRIGAFGAVDTWFRDCSSDSVDDGTAYQAAFFNAVLAQLRGALRGMLPASALDNADDDMLDKALKAARLQFVSDTGTANAISVTLPTAPPAWGVPLTFFVVIGGGNTNTQSAVTIAVAGLSGTKNVVKRDGTALGIADLVQNTAVLMAYDGTSVRVMSSVPSDFLNLLRTTVPIFPEITATGNVFTFTVTSGQIVINAGLGWLHRGVYLDSTNNYAAGARTFATNANRTLHLRWQYNGGTPQFVLKDLADSGYNPSSLAETDPSFDSTYDDMLVARIVTNSANALAVTPLINKARATYKASRSSMVFLASGNWGVRSTDTYTFNLARTPRANFSAFDPNATGFAVDSEEWALIPTATRYAVSIYGQTASAYTGDAGSGLGGSYMPIYSYNVEM